MAACSAGKDAKGDRPPAAVGYVVAQPTTVPIAVTLNGRTVAYETSEVRPQVTGIIRKRFFDEGGYVRAGQPLYEIDPSLYLATVNQAQANLASARATADAATAKANRYKPLAEMEAIAQQDYTDAAAEARMARAAVEQNAAALETARINLRFTTVPAPISGRIGRSLVTVGGLASANQTNSLALIQRTDPIFVDMQQSASDLTALRNKLASGDASAGNATVLLKLEDGSPYPLRGTVQFSEVTVDQSTGTVTLRARFPNPDGVLLPGMFVTATFEQGNDPSAFVVTQQAVLRDFDGKAYVLLIGKDNKVIRRTVTADRTYGTNFVVTKGIARGDKVITQGLNGLKQGMQVRPVPASAPDIPLIEERSASTGSVKGG